jgi:Kef-type K+ transport system membrane component KefB
MSKEKNNILDTVASILVVFAFLAVFWYLISEWISAVKNPQTRVMTLIATIIAIVAMTLIYNNPEFVQSLLKE